MIENVATAINEIPALGQHTDTILAELGFKQKWNLSGPIVDSTFTLAVVTGQSVSDISQNAMANLDWDEARLPNPLFESDTIYSQSGFWRSVSRTPGLVSCVSKRLVLGKTARWLLS
jgi:MaoC like domain